MIDFPQMVSVSHRNAQMYFDRDIGCIYKFFKKRFNLTEKGGHDGSETDDDDDNGRPSFLSIQKSFGALDKELAASGFTKKEQVEIEKAEVFQLVGSKLNTWFSKFSPAKTFVPTIHL